MDPGTGGVLDYTRWRHKSDLLCHDAVPLWADRPADASSSSAPGCGGDSALPLADKLSGGTLAWSAYARRSIDRLGSPGRMVARKLYTGPHHMARGNTGLFGGGRMKYLRLFGAFFRVSVMGETAYRVNFFIQVFQSLLNLGISLAGLAVIFSYTNTLGGWRPDEVLALVGVYFLVGGIIGVVIQPGMEQLIEAVRTGTFDFTLTKPEDAQLVVSIQRVEIWKLIDIVLGFAVLLTALIRVGEKVGGWQAVAFIALLLAGAVIIYSFWLILATLSFWFIRVENILVIFQSLYEAGRWPVSLYPGWLRYGLTFIVPVAFATTVPVEALTGRLTWETILGAVMLAAVLFTGSRLFWRVGLRRYSGTSA